jgi:TonB family protein
MKSAYFIISLLIFNVSFAQEGLVKSYYANDTIKSEINYERNVRQGEAKFYYENGNLKEELTYVNGKVDGVVKEYNEDGLLKELYNLESGKRQGPTSYYDDKGVWTGDKNFEDGVLVVEKEPEPKEIVESSQPPADESTATNKPAEKNTVKVRKTEEKTLPPTVQEENFDDDPAYYLSAEVMPEPKGGIAELQKKLIYPSYAKENEIEGTVKIKAFIDQNGDVTRAEVEKGIGYGCDESARITVLYAKFNPGLIRGKPVKTQVVIPLEFKLPEKD